MTELNQPRKIRKLGQLKWFKTPNGHTVIVLPTCSVPHSHLMPENWAEYDSQYQGTNRLIRLWTELKDGTKLGKNALFEKGPERTLQPTKLYATNYTDHDVQFFPGESRNVEEQVKWEARILLELKKLKRPAEQPQAIILKKIEWPNGDVQWEKSLITKMENISRKWKFLNKTGIVNGYTRQDKIKRKLTKSQLEPVDAAYHNQIPNRRGGTIIDVARWQVNSPKYKKFRVNLQNEVTAKYFEEKRTKK